jgi:ribosomal protein S18 acetylase RimI-like enzyme
MVAEGPHHYELAKMAVDPSCQGRGYANLLMESAIAWARAQGAHAITLLSNTKLVPAIKLYEKYGFVTVHLGPHAHYKRTDIEMRLPL